MLEEPDLIAAVEQTASEKRYGTEKDGISVLLEDPRMQRPDVATKKEILKLLYVSGAFKPSSFDAVMTDQASPPLTVDNVAEHLHHIRLVEMKTTRASIRNAWSSR